MIKQRCAIYTRKSSEEGLEQDFNSLHAQREACAAYVMSQASEGWSLIPDVYDDGGISGGTLERPALRRLLADIAANRIDIVVVYKVDRLTRSLLDFSKLVEAFDTAGTSFVSVTQSFNTTTSMGRLTLNMLLSFAQFEREVTAERIRDKIAASKAKGMWMGGTPPLGYEPDGRSLAIVEDHAAIIRDIYKRYLDTGNVRLVAEQLVREGIRSPKRIYAKTGQSYGGVCLSRGQIYTILRNPIYTGRIAHRDQLHAGQHPAIIDTETWDQVQQCLTDNVRGSRSIRRANTSLLAGRIVDGNNEPLIATHACKGKQRYRYYVSRSLQVGDAAGEGKGVRVPARDIERVVSEAVATLFDDPVDVVARAWLDLRPAMLAALTTRCTSIAVALRACNAASPIVELVAQVRVTESGIEIDLSAQAIGDMLDVHRVTGAADTLTIACEAAIRRTGRRVTLVQANGRPTAHSGPSVSLIKLIVQARIWWAVLAKGEETIKQFAARERVTASWMTRVVRLAFLAPALVEAVLDGGRPIALDAVALVGTDAVPAAWAEQVKRYGLG